MIQQTSLSAYTTSDFTPDARRLYKVMLLLAEKYGDCTDTECALTLGWEKARVSARRNDLITHQVVDQSRKRPSYIGDSNRTHQAWRALL